MPNACAVSSGLQRHILHTLLQLHLIVVYSVSVNAWDVTSSVDDKLERWSIDRVVCDADERWTCTRFALCGYISHFKERFIEQCLVVRS